MADSLRKALWGKIALQGKLRCVTGLHIGASKDALEIAGVDAPIVRDPLDGEPYAPGSSIKGKLRALLERAQRKEFNRYSGQGVHRHECSDPQCQVCRLFGSTTSGGGALNMPSRLIVRDARLTDDARERLKLMDSGLPFAEWKFENALDRVSAAANPRQIERAPAGAEFAFEIVYALESFDADEIEQDLTNLLLAMALLEDDYLGGHGSRGCGGVRWAPEKFVGRTLAYYAAAAAAERDAAQVAYDVQSLDECREKTSELVLKLLEAAQPPLPDAPADEPAPDAPAE